MNNQEKKTKSGKDFWTVNPKGQVPVLELDNGEKLTEGPVVVQYLADQKPASGLLPPVGSTDRYRVQEWLNFITSELHKSLVRSSAQPRRRSSRRSAKKISLSALSYLDKQVTGRQYLMGDKFTVADAYLFTVLRWTARIEMDLAKWPNLKAYFDRVAARPKVHEAMKEEGLIAA